MISEIINKMLKNFIVLSFYFSFKIFLMSQPKATGYGSSVAGKTYAGYGGGSSEGKTKSKSSRKVRPTVEKKGDVAELQRYFRILC